MRLISFACFVVAMAGCSLADPSLYEALADGSMPGVDGHTGTDAPVPDGTPPGDGGSQLAVDRCGDPLVFVIRDTQENITIDTRSLVNDVSSLPGCGGLPTPGNEGFLAVDVQPGEEWHFHLRVDNALDPDPTSRNPTLYVVNDACSTTMCRQELLANFCDQQQDEHFAYTFPEMGRWYVGIDDTNAGGGVYLLDAVRPMCGNARAEHGEACEGQEGCGTDCRWIVNEESVQERGFNFNFKESNRVVLPPVNELEIRGDIGGFEGCGYPDVFAIDVPAGARLEVQHRNGDGTPCMGAGAPNLGLTLRNAANMIRGGDIVGGCAVVDETFPSAGLFFVVVEDLRPDMSRPLTYRLNFRLTP